MKLINKTMVMRRNKNTGSIILNGKKELHCRSRGQASIEFILIIPLLIIVVLIVSQLGYLVYLQNTLEQAAREGTRIISTTNSNSAAYKQVYTVCHPLDRSRINIEISPPGPGNRVVGDTVRIIVSYNYGGIANFLNFITGRNFMVKSSSVMRMESN